MKSIAKYLRTALVSSMVLFSCLSLTACTPDLTDYRAKKLEELQAYADAMMQENQYGIAGLQTIERAVIDCKNSVESARRKKGIDAAISQAKSVIDSVEMNIGAMNGAYFEATDGGYFAIINNNVMTLSEVVAPSQAGAENIVSDTYEFSFVEGVYIGVNIRSRIDFSFQNLKKEMIVYKEAGANVKEIRLVKNAEITLADDSEVTLAAPQNVEIIETDFIVHPKDINLMWYPSHIGGKPEPASRILYSMGVLGAGISVKGAGQEVFDLVQIHDFIPEPYSGFNILLSRLNLPQGAYAVEVAYMGGLFLSENQIKISESSAPILLNITVDEHANYTITKI